MGEIITRPNSGSSGSVRIRKSKPQNDAMIIPPLKVEGYVPTNEPARNTRWPGRVSKLPAVVEILNANPGMWYKVALGKTGTVNAVMTRLKAMDNTLRFDKRDEDGQWGLYASAPDIY